MYKTTQEEIKSVKLGKKIRLEYIPFSKLINPWRLCGKGIFQSTSIDSVPLSNSRALKTIKGDKTQALIYSIRQFGLLNPLYVWKIPENYLPEETKKWLIREYVIIDGQRRYFAIEQMFNLKKYKETNFSDFIFVPCIVYDYEKLSECARHSIEDNKFSVRPSQIYLECAERQHDILPNIRPEIEVYKAIKKMQEKFDQIIRQKEVKK